MMTSKQFNMLSRIGFSMMAATRGVIDVPAFLKLATKSVLLPAGLLDWIVTSIVRTRNQDHCHFDFLTDKKETFYYEIPIIMR